MLEFMEAREQVVENCSREMLASQMEELQNSYSEAVAGGFTDMAETYQEKMKELSQRLEAKKNPENNLSAHQGKETGDVENRLGAHQGEALSEDPKELDKKLAAHQGQEISFGSSNIEKYDSQVRQAERDIKHRKEIVEYKIRNGQDTGTAVRDLKYAQNRYEKASSDRDRAIKNSKP